MKFKMSLAALLIAMAPFSYAHDIHWSYESPEKWGDLGAAYQTCKTGVNQSPVNIHNVVNGQLKSLDLEYHAKQKSIVNNGHTIQIDINDGDTFKLDDETYTLRQFHFHAPSENRIEGKSFPLEVHFVHSNEHGQLAVVGVMFEAGEANPAIESILQNVPSKVNQVKALDKPLNLATLIPDNKSYYRFSGSLTTPPCSEGVRWLVMKDSVHASSAQLASFARLLGEHGNSRPVQPLNGRLIVE
ncbi:carbonic anhydrase family protein [Pantoea sp. CTOTU49201]|uniref:carbonic anhydrase n=1 Tax=Pantoea sp. CTOTU49201 TaxID=2953855 RepID=UPI00289C1B01|nr:carbonic anhydrase family protein [Pantoea sp. CTOTU49201]